MNADLLRLVVVTAVAGVSCARVLDVGVLGRRIHRPSDPFGRVAYPAVAPGLAYLVVEWATTRTWHPSWAALSLVAMTTLLAIGYVAAGGRSVPWTAAARRGVIIAGYGAVSLLLAGWIAASAGWLDDQHRNAPVAVVLGASVALGAAATESLAQGAAWPRGAEAIWLLDGWDAVVIGFVGLELLMLQWMPAAQAAPALLVLVVWLWYRRRRLRARGAAREMSLRTYAGGWLQAAGVWALLLSAKDVLPW